MILLCAALDFQGKCLKFNFNRNAVKRHTLIMFTVTIMFLVGICLSKSKAAERNLCSESVPMQCSAGIDFFCIRLLWCLWVLTDMNSGSWWRQYCSCIIATHHSFCCSIGAFIISIGDCWYQNFCDQDGIVFFLGVLSFHCAGKNISTLQRNIFCFLWLMKITRMAHWCWRWGGGEGGQPNYKMTRCTTR